MKLTNTNWPTFASEVAAPADPLEYSTTAVEKLCKELDKYIVRVKNVRPQFKAINNVQVIEFRDRKLWGTEEPIRDYYSKAMQRYLERKAKLMQDKADGINIGIMILVEFMIFSQAAELCRAEILADAMYASVMAGKAAGCAVKFKATLILIVKILNEKYGISRDMISLIWGGGQTQLTKKQKNKANLQANEKAMEAMEAAGITMDDLDLEEVEVRVQETLPEHLRLGIQSKKDRQREIDKYQRGDSLYCIYTFKAGGVGLSLHHSDELTIQKVRHKKNGYAFLEDIPKIPVRPRENYVAPTFSAIDLVQALGRMPRLTSLSDTLQTLIFFAGTIEEHIANIVRMKLKCLSKVVQTRESWEDVIDESANAQNKAMVHLSKTDNFAPDEDGELVMANGGEENVEQEDE